MLLRRCFVRARIRQLAPARRAYSTQNASSPSETPHNEQINALNPREKSGEEVLQDILLSLRPESSHNDLPSFLAYASKAGLDPSTTVYKGTRYEYLAQSSLKRLGFTLIRSGGANDFGTDLLGTWHLPLPKPLTLKILIQCKALASRGSPHQIRELEGAFSGAPMAFRGKDVMALLVSQRPATKGMRDALARSGWPMGCVTCSDEGRVMQMLWNKKAEELGLEGVCVGVRHGKDGEKGVVLLWEGEALPAVKGK